MSMLKRPQNIRIFILCTFVGLSIAAFMYLLFSTKCETTAQLWEVAITCSLGGTILVIAMIVSEIMRCIIFLALPIFFTGRGRVLILAYVLTLCASGSRSPYTNAIANLDELMRTMSCTQSLTYNASRAFINKKSSPITNIKKKINETLENIQKQADDMKRNANIIANKAANIGKYLKFSNIAMSRFNKICEDKFNNPEKECLRNANFIKRKTLCVLVKRLAVRCEKFKKLKFGLSERVEHMKNTIEEDLYFNYTFTEELSVNHTESKNYEKVIMRVMKNLKEKYRILFSVLSYFDFWIIVTILLLILGGFTYRRKYFSDISFDNNYITNNLREIDRINYSNKRNDTLFPLSRFEKLTFIRSTQIIWLSSEFQTVFRIFLNWTFYAAVISTYLAADYLIYQLNIFFAKHGRFQTHNFNADEVKPQFVFLNKTTGKEIDFKNVATEKQSLGNRIMGDMNHGIVETNPKLSIDTQICLPNPRKPDTYLRRMILAILSFSLITVVIQPYSERFRHYICDKLYPDQAQRRAQWLYNRIRAKRQGKMWNMLFNSIRNEDKLDWWTRFTYKYPIIGKLLKRNQEFCVDCSKGLTTLEVKELKARQQEGFFYYSKNYTGPMQCGTCKNIYCTRCAAENKFKCPICTKKHFKIGNFIRRDDSSLVDSDIEAELMD
ncbi:hypothetical protein SNEBB_004610 [Seison nebaliae]|nr:hypothetical protein SNEBB_004610 [Seison nebaliae]